MIDRARDFLKRLAVLGHEPCRGHVGGVMSKADEERFSTLYAACLLYTSLDMAGKLLVQAGLSYDLAKSRFDLGLTSIVDLEQADLSRTSASMTESAVKQDYLIQLAVLDNRLGVHVAPAIAPTQAGQR